MVDLVRDQPDAGRVAVLTDGLQLLRAEHRAGGVGRGGDDQPGKGTLLRRKRKGMAELGALAAQEGLLGDPLPSVQRTIFSGLRPCASESVPTDQQVLP